MINNKEHEKLCADIVTTLCNKTIRLFKLNSGQGWMGQTINGPLKHVELGPKDKLIRNARILRAGITTINAKSVNGIPDIVGIETITITPEMVGQQVAVLKMVEVKTGRGELKKDQKKFHEFARRFGIRIGVARSVDDARNI